MAKAKKKKKKKDNKKPGRRSLQHERAAMAYEEGRRRILAGYDTTRVYFWPLIKGEQRLARITMILSTPQRLYAEYLTWIKQ